MSGSEVDGATGGVRADDLTRVRLGIAYDGAGFAGWAKQPGLRTVQGELEAALQTVLGRVGPAPTLTVAGRTDAGVHASGQVAHLDVTPSQLLLLGASAASLAGRLNGTAGAGRDLVVGSATIVSKDFDARFSALWRRYEYRIADRASERDPRRRGYEVWYPATLDVEVMNDAAAELLGLHDWAAYCRPREGATTIRELHAFSWRRDVSGVVVGKVQADAFCHSMVRSLVGAAVSVGAGKLSTAQPAALRDDGRRTSAFSVMPAHGLVLTGVDYPADDQLAARAALTRDRRTV